MSIKKQIIIYVDVPDDAPDGSDDDFDSLLEDEITELLPDQIDIEIDDDTVTVDLDWSGVTVRAAS